MIPHNLIHKYKHALIHKGFIKLLVENNTQIDQKNENIYIFRKHKLKEIEKKTQTQKTTKIKDIIKKKKLPKMTQIGKTHLHAKKD